MMEIRKQGRDALTKRYFEFLESKANAFASAILTYVTWDSSSFPITLQFHWNALLSYADMLGFTLIKECYKEERSETLQLYWIPLLEQRTGLCMKLILGTNGVTPQDKDTIQYEVVFEVMGAYEEGIHYQYQYLISQNQMQRIV